MKWTSVQDAVLRECAASQMSYGQAARKLGVTRNMVAGRAHRLGVKFTPSPWRTYPLIAEAAQKRLADPVQRAAWQASIREGKRRAWSGA